MTSIGNWAFDDCENLQEVISKIENPFNIETNIFSYYTYNNATLYVPIGTINNYKSKEGWNGFANIEEGIPSGIGLTVVSNANEIEHYSIDGKKIPTSQRGINIVKMSDGTTKKVVVK